MMEPDRMRLPGVRSPEEDEIGVLRFLVRARAPARSQDCRQTDDGRSVSGPVAAVDVVVAEDLPGEFRRQKVDFVGRLGAAEYARRGSAVLGQVATEALGGAVERFVPRRGTESAVVADEGLSEARVGAWRIRAAG